MRIPSGRSRAWLAALILGAVAATAGPLLPAAVPVARPLAGALEAQAVRAADGLSIITATRYVVDPAGQAVRVTIDVTARNTTRDRISGNVISRYYFSGIGFAIHEEAARVRATSGATNLRVTTRDEDGFTSAQVSFGRNIFAGQTARLRIAYDLPGGEPRSDSDIRVGSAFATFYTWAFGDSGSVEIVFPDTFDVVYTGDPVFARSEAGGNVTFSADVDDPRTWFAWMTGSNDAALTSEPIELASGDEVVVHGWPEDAAWRAQVTTILESGLPELHELIGLEWPVKGSLDIYEVHTPLLEGYAGFYDPSEDRITVSEDLDALVIVHEASHAWFNGGLFSERWINEGLADEYAALVLEAIGEPSEDPLDVSPDSAAAFALETWRGPASIRDEEAAAYESYGYNASWTVMRAIVEATGLDGMRAVFAAASARTIAYVGDVPPEADLRSRDWRRLLDLLEEVGGAEDVVPLFETWVVDDFGRERLELRAEMREAYADLVAAGDGWLPPYYVRSAVARWEFDEADRKMGLANDVLERRAALDAAAAAAGLTVPDGLEEAYETAKDDLDEATALADAMRTSLDEVVAADATLTAPRDLFMTLGLDGDAAQASLGAAESAWEAGDLEGAVAQADAVDALVAIAPETGRTRLLVGVGVAGALVLLLVLVVVMRRRRARHARTLAAALAAPAATAPAATLDAVSIGPGDLAAVGDLPTEPSPPDGPVVDRGPGDAAS